MNAMEIEVFRAGDYGPRGAFTADDLRRIADDYDPAKHEAPVTLDHRQDGPAYGWVEALRCAGDVLVARLKDLHESMREWIRTGAYKKRSIELYRAFGPTGRPYLRAVSFLGACPPAVKGLADPLFREDEGERVVLEFEEAPPAESAPTKAAPENDSDRATQFVEEKPLSNVHNVHSVHSVHEPPATVAFADFESLRDDAERLTAELERMRRDRRRDGLERFCEAERQSGRILPAWEAGGLIEFMLSLDEGAPIEAGDGRRVTPLEWFQEFLRALPPQIELRELATPAREELRRPAMPRPTDRMALRPSTLVLHEQAVAYCQRNAGATYIEALESVSRL